MLDYENYSLELYEYTGILCPKCGSKKHGVVDSRRGNGYIRRRRKCFECDYRFTTKEMVSNED